MATILVLVVIAMAVPRWRRGAPSPIPPPAAKPSTAEIATVPPAPQSASVPNDGAPVQLELRTLAPVWIRVVVDGEKKVEGLIPATQLLSFKAAQSVVVRAGNGADLLVKIDNHEDTFGAAGQPLTRTFVPRSGQDPPNH